MDLQHHVTLPVRSKLGGRTMIGTVDFYDASFLRPQQIDPDRIDERSKPYRAIPGTAGSPGPDGEPLLQRNLCRATRVWLAGHTTRACATCLRLTSWLFIDWPGIVRSDRAHRRWRADGRRYSHGWTGDGRRHRREDPHCESTMIDQPLRCPAQSRSHIFIELLRRTHRKHTRLPAGAGRNHPAQAERPNLRSMPPSAPLHSGYGPRRQISQERPVVRGPCRVSNR